MSDYADPSSDVPDLAAYFDVPALIAASRPQLGGGVLLVPPLGLGALLGAMAVTALASGPWATAAAIALLVVSAACMVYLARLTAAARSERSQVRQADELVTLRHWPQAAALLKDVLGRPMRLGPSRRAALVALVRTLGRYGLYDEAVEAADAAVEGPIDPATRFALACGRAMLLLQAGRLSDANDAIGRLKSDVRQIDAALRRARRQAEENADSPPADDDAEVSAEALLDEPDTVIPPEAAEGFDPAALTVVELYRDVQTFHADEALEVFESRRDGLREQLGARFGDALALAAVAAGRSDRPGDARQWWADATNLVPADELLRRYPEVREVADAHPATPWPEVGA